MRPRAVGGLEPDDAEQKELVELWHLSHMAFAVDRPDVVEMLAKLGSVRAIRLDWVVNWFLKKHPDVARKWVYVWAERHLGVLVDPDPVEYYEGGMGGDQGGVPVYAKPVPTGGHAKPVPSRSKRRSSKKRAK